MGIREFDSKKVVHFMLFYLAQCLVMLYCLYGMPREQQDISIHFLLVSGCMNMQKLVSLIAQVKQPCPISCYQAYYHL